MAKKPGEKNPLPPNVEESNSEGVDVGDATSGVEKEPEEWAEEQPIVERPTYALEPGDPMPFQPAAGSPEAEKAGRKVAEKAKIGSDRAPERREDE